MTKPYGRVFQTSRPFTYELSDFPHQLAWVGIIRAVDGTEAWHGRPQDNRSTAFKEMVEANVRLDLGAELIPALPDEPSVEESSAA